MSGCGFNSNGEKRRPGQPLIMLAVLVLGWVSMRFVFWSEPYVMPLNRVEIAGELGAGDSQSVMASDSAGQNQSASPVSGADIARSQNRSANGARLDDWRRPTVAPALAPIRAPLPVTPQTPALQMGTGQNTIGQREPERAPARMIVGHNLMLVAGLSQLQLPPLVQAYLDNAAQTKQNRLAQSLAQAEGQAQSPAQAQSQAGRNPVAPASRGLANRPAAERSTISRWSADSWLLLRRDTTTPILSGRPSYGRSQAGAVLRYRLAPNSGNRPQAYARASTAIEGARDNEVSLGLSARPLVKIPVRVAAEMRVSQTSSGSELRPAAFAVSEFPPLDLPLGARAEAYVQAGYVGGDNATAFIDGQLRVTKPVAKMGPAEFEAGGGIWGGAQDEGKRLDIGPSASVSFDLGAARSRVAVDYRFRVGGDAEPSSGPTLTLSAGF